MSVVTARGHSEETLKAGVQVLARKGLIPQEPNYHRVFPVGNPSIRAMLGDERQTMTIPALKKKAIVEFVDAAVAEYATEPDLHFGMSDDDPQNIQLIVTAMCECKKKYVNRRFFVINTHQNQEVKLEVFPADFAVTGTAPTT